MSRSYLLLTDALINLALGVVLVAFPKAVAEAFGLPDSASGAGTCCGRLD